MKAKKFDCMEMKRQGASRIYEETKDLSLKEEAQYWREKSEKMKRRNRRHH
jgi:hypothetical protein